MTGYNEIRAGESVAVIVTGAQALVKTTDPKPFPPPAPPALKDYPAIDQPTAPVQRLISAAHLAYWGSNNTYPQDALDHIRSVPDLLNAINWRAKALYGGGFVYGTAYVDDAGNKQIQRAKDPNVETFLRRSRVWQYFRDVCWDLYAYRNIYPQIILSRDHRQIVNINRQDAAFCRKQRQNPDNGLIENVFINANWRIGPANEENSFEIPILDRFYDPVERLKEMTGDIFMLPETGTLAGTVYYGIPEWDTLVQSTWLDLLKSIPKFKAAIMANQTTIKYLVNIPSYYWTQKYKNWESLTPEEQVANRQQTIQEFENVMVGAAGAGKNIYSLSYFDAKSSTLLEGWKIEAIDNKFTDGMYIEDSQEATTKLMAACNVNPSLLGMNPGQGMASGSGADERVAFNNYMSLTTSDIELVCAPFKEIIGPYNGWPDYDYGFFQPMIMTLDKGKQVQQQTS